MWLTPQSMASYDENGRAEVAQVVEHATENRGVGSSTLPLGTNGKISGYSATEHPPDRIIYPPPSARRAGVAQG